MTERNSAWLLATAANTFFRGAGKMAALARARDWPAAPLLQQPFSPGALARSVAELPVPRPPRPYTP